MRASPTVPAPSPGRIRGNRLAGAALAGVLAGCARAPPPDLSADPAELLQAVRAAQGRVRRVAGSARIRVEAPGSRGSFEALAAAEKPGRLRLEALDFFGSPAALLAASGGRFVFFDARRGVWYRGEATPENVSQLLPVALPVEELVEILCGSAPLLSGAPAAAIAGRGVVHLDLAGGGLVQRLDVGAEAAVEASRVRAAGGAPAGYDLAFAVFRHRAGVRFPGEVEIEARAARARVAFAWREVAVNGPADDALFRLEPPPGARVVELAGGAAAPPPELPLAPE